MSAVATKTARPSPRTSEMGKAQGSSSRVKNARQRSAGTGSGVFLGDDGVVRYSHAEWKRRYPAEWARISAAPFLVQDGEG